MTARAPTALAFGLLAAAGALAGLPAAAPAEVLTYYAERRPRGRHPPHRGRPPPRPAVRLGRARRRRRPVRGGRELRRPPPDGPADGGADPGGVRRRAGGLAAGPVRGADPRPRSARPAGRLRGVRR